MFRKAHSRALSRNIADCESDEAASSPEFVIDCGMLIFMQEIFEGNQRGQVGKSNAVD